MIISVISPHTNKNGNTVSSILLALGLGELKRKVLLTHVKPQSPAFKLYLGLKAYEDKTTTPTQLVKLMREGAIQPEEIGDYCKVIDDYVDVFTNDQSNFSEDDMASLLSYLLKSSLNYEYVVIDVDETTDKAVTQKVIANSDIVIINLSPSVIDLDEFNNQKEKIMKLTAGKKVILLTSIYDAKACKLKDIARFIDVKTNILMIRYNSWIKYGCNFGKLVFVYKQSKQKDPAVIEISKDVASLVSAVSKAKISISRRRKAKGGLK